MYFIQAEEQAAKYGLTSCLFLPHARGEDEFDQLVKIARVLGTDDLYRCVRPDTLHGRGWGQCRGKAVLVAPMHLQQALSSVEGKF